MDRHGPGAVTHEELWRIVQQLPEDYEPYGQTSRDQADGVWAVDCSAGCRYYVKLAGTLGMDWGVCAHPRSHRCGLLTFEHQGCLAFEEARDDDDHDRQVEDEVMGAIERLRRLGTCVDPDTGSPIRDP